MAITNFIATIWAARLVENLQKALVYGQTGVINRDYEGEIRGLGDTVKILSIGPVSVGNYTKDNDMSAPQALSDAAQTLVIGQAKYFNFAVDDVDRAQTRVDIMDAAMREAAYALRDAADQYIASVMVSGVAAGNVIGSSGSPLVLVGGTPGSGQTNVYEAIVNLGVELDEANVPREGRWIIVPPWVYGLLQKDTRFVANVANSQAGRVISNGFVGQIAGFDVLMSNNVPSSSGVYQVVAGVARATTYAEQINSVEAYRPERRFADAVKGLHLYGAKVILPSALAMMYCQAAS